MTGSAPAPIVPVPAASRPVLRGHRVIVGVPGLGWRADLRADDPVVRGSRTFVPVITEQDFYRAETEDLEVFAPLVPIDRVWVEQVTEGDGTMLVTITLDAPPRRLPVPASLATAITGSRVVRGVPDGHIRGLRAVTEIYDNDSGAACARVCDEAEWYAWALSGATPATVEVPADLLWLE
ncbi:hypothetical protein GCM10009682_32800 [Luedemannella flava]|uniref:Uncharacterized protein n=1 Tax=Luedemannella flava TaxID=349316 RepID=A0ABN2M3P6_9ACTN